DLNGRRNISPVQCLSRSDIDRWVLPNNHTMTSSGGIPKLIILGLKTCHQLEIVLVYRLFVASVIILRGVIIAFDVFTYKILRFRYIGVTIYIVGVSG